MIRVLLLGAGLCLSAGCQFTRQVIVDEKGEWFPWSSHDDNPEKKKKWDAEKAQWQKEDAERRAKFGLNGGIQEFQSER